MFKALMGGNRSSSDVASTSSSKSSRRRKDSKSTASRKSSRGDDRERGLGDLSAYSPSSSRRSRADRESIASPADPENLLESDRMVIERVSKGRSNDGRHERYRDGDDWDSKSARRRDRDRSSRDYVQRSRTLDDLDDFDREREGSRKERRRTQSGDPYPPPLNTEIPAPGTSEHFAANISAPGFSQFPMQYDAMVPGSTTPEQTGSPSVYDPHVHQQFPGQFPEAIAEPYRPPNPAGEAADYYGDQGQSVAEQPGVRPKPPAVIPNSQAHLMPASPSANPPPEPSSIGQVGAAAAYYTDDPESQAYEQPAMPPNPSQSHQAASTIGPATAAAAGAAAYGVGSGLHGHGNSPPHSAGPIGPSDMTYTQPAPASPHKPSHSHMGAAVGAAAATAAAGYMIGHHHHSSSSPEQLPQYGIQNYEYPSHGVGPMYGPGPNPALVAPGAAGVAGYGPATAHGMHSYGGPGSHGPGFHSGGLAFQQRQRGPLDKFVDFWRDPEGVGMFEDYTETIGLCRYCFEPGTTSRDAPRKHHYNRRRRSWDRHSNGSRVDKLSRFPSSEEEGRRRRKSKSKSWLPGLLAGYAAKSLFSNKSFDDSYSVKSGRVLSPRHSMDDSESISTLDRKSQTSRGVYRHSNRSRSRDRYDNSSYSDLKGSRYDRHHTRSRSRSRSSSRSRRHSALRDAALGAAVGSAAMSMSKSRHRSRSPKMVKSRKGSSSLSDSSSSDASRPSKKSVAGGLASFFMTPSANRKKRPSKRNKGFFSFNNSSSSSLDADLAFGGGYKKKKGSRNSKKKADRERNIDARLLGLGAAATALAASSHRHNRRTGEILAARDSRSGRSDYSPSATNDDGWEDLDSADQSSSSVSSALAFGGDDSQTSDSGTSKWDWRWGGGKKDKKKRRSNSSGGHRHTGAAVAAGALGGAALGSAYHHSHSKPPSQDNVSSTGSLQRVFPVPTTDPSKFDAVRVPSGAQPALVRPGPIPLQQPQPVTPVSHAVYTTQGEPAYYPALSGPPGVGNVYPGYTPQNQDSYMGQRDLGYKNPNRRSESFPIFSTESREDVSTTGPKRRSTMKDQASVQFDLTEEQMRKERRADRRDRERYDGHYDQGPQLIDREHELALQDAERQARRRDRENEALSRDVYYDRSSRLFRPPADSEDWERRRKDPKKADSSSWVGAAAAAAGTIGAAAAASALSDKKSRDDSSEISQGRYSERREKRRAERRRADSQTESAVSEGRQTTDDIPPVSQTDADRSQPELYGASSRTPPHDNYAQFFAPEGLQHSPDSQAREQSMPRIVEVEPANERFSREMSQYSEASYEKPDTLPWPVPRLNLIEPTPPQSVSGSVRGVTSPTSAPADRPLEKAEKPEKQKPASRVSWGEHHTHEYDVPSTSPERDSSDNDGMRELERSKGDAPYAQGQEPSTGYGADVEFAATVAAATAAAGFDPSLVTDDPAYHTRAPQYDPALPRGEPHGFVEGEVETSDSEGKGKRSMAENSTERPKEAEPGIEHFIEGKPFYSEPESFAKDREAPPAAEEKGSSSDPELIERPTREHSDAEQHFSMPGGFEPDDSPRQSRDRDIFDARTDTRSVFSAPVAGEFESLSRSKKSGRSDEDLENIGDNVSEHAEAEGAEEKRKRRKRRSKRHSGNIDDTTSVTSSPAKIEEVSQKRGNKNEKKTQSSGGFFSSIFGSRVSEPAEPRRSSSVDGHSREVKSEIGTGEREESRRRKKRSSRHRSSGSMDVLEDPGQFGERDLDQEEPVDVNIENYKSHRQRREDRRRHKYEDIYGSGKGPDYEKDRKDDDNADRQSFLERGPEMLDDREDGASGLASAMAAGAAGLGLGMMGEHLRNRSTSPTAERTAEPPRPTSPDMPHDGQERGQRSRRASMMNDSPTAVPLHFRRPPISPGANRPASTSSPAAPQPESPTQPRHRRPASTEFKNSREIRPLWLVERHGGKVEDELDEPLPSLPSSKPSSRSPSMEDLKTPADQDVRSWEPVDVSHYAHEGRRSPGLRISTGKDDPYVEHDVLGSQQTTPTAKSFSAADQSVKKEKPKYEFHSPSELLQDPSVYAELPPSPTLGALPSAEGSAVGVSDGSAEKDHLERNLENLPPLPDSRPATPPQEQDQEQLPTPVAEAAPTETNEESTRSADIAKGVGFAGIVGAAVSAAAKGTEKESTRELSDEQGHTDPKGEALESDTIGRKIEPVTTEQNVPQDLEATSQSRDLPEELTPSSPSQQAAPAGFAGVDESAVPAADSKDDKGVKAADTTQADHVEEHIEGPVSVVDEKRDLEELPSADREGPADIQAPAESADKAADETSQAPVEEVPLASSSKKKKKNKKKKGQSMDLAEQESTPASPAAENDTKPEEPVVEQEPILDATGVENVPSGEEASRELEAEPAQPEEPQPEVVPAADAEETPAPEVSSKKAKRDKKKKRKSKGPEFEEQPAESGTGEAEQPATEAVTEQESMKPPTEDPQTTEVIPGEEASKELGESISSTRDGPTEPKQPLEQELEQVPPPEETKELSVEQSGIEHKHDQTESQEQTREPDDAPVEWQDALESPADAQARQLPEGDKQEAAPEISEKDGIEAVPEPAAVSAEPEQSHSETQQETTQEPPAPVEDSAPAEVASESPAQDQEVLAADHEPETGLSRKASKKNKKKNKRKSTAETPVESKAAEAKELPTGGEILEGQAEPRELPEPALESEQIETQLGQDEGSAQDAHKQDGTAPEPAIDAQAEPTAVDAPSGMEQPQEVSGVEGAEEPKKKGKKGKKNRKSSVSEAQPEPELEPESKPEQSEFVDAPESQPPQTSDDVPAVDEDQPSPETKYEDAPAIETAEPAAPGTEEEATSFGENRETDIEGNGASEQPSTIENLPAETEAQAAQVGNETPKDITADTQESQAAAEADIPLTPAQKKKAKKDKKKKRQSSLVEETLAPEPAAEPTEKETAPEGGSATAPPEHTDEASKEVGFTEDSTAGLDKDITGTTEETAQSESADHVATVAESAPAGEDQETREVPAQEEPKDTTTEAVEEPVASATADADSTQQEPKDGTSLTAEATSTDERQEVTPELEPQIDESKTATATEEQVPGAKTALEDSQEPAQEETTSGPSQEQAQEQDEDAESAASKKSKKDKKKKKKRQSLAPEDEPTEQVAPSGDAEVGDTPSDAAADNETKAEDVPLEGVVPETTSAEAVAPEPVEEPLSATSKKKAKKDKKKRKSVSFDIEEPAEQPTDSAEAAPADVTPQADEAKPEDTTELPAVSPEAIESRELEKERELSVDSPKEELSATADDQGESNQAVEPAPAEDQTTGPSPDPTTEEATESQAATAIPDLDNQPPSGEEKTDAETPASEPEKTSATDTVPEPESAKDTEAATGTEPVTTEGPSTPEPQSPKPDDAEQETGAAKSKKDKKKKKKRKTLELTEEAPEAVPEPVNDAQPEPDRAADPETTDVKDPEEAASQAPEKEEPGKQVDDKQDEKQEPEEQEPEKQELDKQEDEKPFMSAKEKRKAKKDKKRQSKLLDRDDNDQNAAASAPIESALTEDATQDMTAIQPTEAETSDPSPATVVPPAEDDGKENQSHDTQPSGDQEKDRIWTDEMVSSQVEQQQATSSAFLPHPEHDRAVDDQSLVPSGNEPESGGPDAGTEEGPSTTPNEPEVPADEGVTHDDKPIADISGPKNETGTGSESKEGVEEVERTEGFQEPENIPSVPTEELIEQSTAPPADPGVAPEAESSKPEEPAAEAEDLVATSSSKKKKKKKQKQKEKQLEESQLTEPAPSADNTEQHQGDAPVTEEPVLSPKENVPELDQVHDEPVAGAVEVETSKEPVNDPEELPLESRQKDDEPVAELMEGEASKELATAPEEPVLEPDQTKDESAAEPIGIEAPKEQQTASEEPPLKTGQKEEEPALEPVEAEAPKELPTASEEQAPEYDQKGDEPSAEPAPELEPPKQHAELTKDVAANVDENVETPGLSRKMSKKEKKKKRRSLAQGTDIQERAEEQPVPEGETGDSTGLDNATDLGSSGDQDDKPPADSDAKQDAHPKEQGLSMEDTAEGPVGSVVPADSMSDVEKNVGIGDSPVPDDENIREQLAETGDVTDAGQLPMEKTEERSRSEPGADEATREIPDQPEDFSIPTSKKKAKKNKKKALAQDASIEESQVEEPLVTSEPTDNAGDVAEPTTEVQPTGTLPDPSTEEKQEGAEEDWAVPSKKKGKKGKKEKQKARAQAEETPTPVDIQDNTPAESASASVNEGTAPPTEDVAMTSEEQPGESEQVQREEPFVPLDPVEAPLESEAMDVDLPTGPTDAGAERELLGGDSRGDLAYREQQEAQEKQESQDPEKKEDIEAAEAPVEDHPKELEDEAPLARKLSKKEKRKAKQKALQGAIESSQQAELEPEPEVLKETEVLKQTTEDPTLTAAEQANEDVPLSRSSSKKKKKAKKDGLSMEPESQEPQEQPEQPEQTEDKEPAVTPTEHAPADEVQPLERQQPQHDEESWPSIDWNKDKAEIPPEHAHEPMPEPQQADIEPGPETIGEFDESAIPWAVAKEPEQPPAEDTWSMPSKKKDKKKKKSPRREAEPVPVPAPELEQETERTIPDEAAKEVGQVTTSKTGKITNVFPDLERGSFRRPATKAASQSGKDNAEDETIDQGAQVSEAPIATIDESGEDAGTWAPPDDRGFGELQSLSTVPDPFTEQTTSRKIDAPAADASYNLPGLSDESPGAARSVETQPEDKDLENMQTSPSRPDSDPTTPSNPTCSLRRSPSIHGKPNHTQRPWSLDETTIETAQEASTPPSLFGGPIGADTTVSPPRTPLGTIAEQEPDSHVDRTGGTMAPGSGTPQLEVKPEHMLPYPHTPVRKFTDNALDRQRWPTPDKELSREVDEEIDGMQKRSRQNSPATPRSDLDLPSGPILKPRSSEKRLLRRTMRSASGDLRATSRAQETGDDPKLPPQPQPQPQPLLSAPADPSIERIASSSSYDPVTDKGKRPVRGMTDVIEGWGETPTSPRSPSRPPSVRHRRSMQHLQDLETRLDQLISENRLLVAAREEAEGKLKNASVARRKSDHALNSRGADLRDKEAEVEQLRSSVEWLQKEVARLTEENEGLTTTNTTVAAAHAQELLTARQSSTRELDDLRSQYHQLSAGTEDRVRQEVETALAAKNAEIRRLHEELEATRGKVKELQQQIATSMDDVLVFRDEDYFDGACQRLCGHVQQWVLRFSKHSDHHRCRKLADLRDEKIADRFDNAILDGSDADAYLADRVRRRDVFMSVVMTMIWEYIFTRYLFGMDRDQRQKLKSLEKHLVEVGSRSAVHRWRATTLTLLSKRAAFSKQRESDTEAVALEIFGTLSRLLPPPTHVEGSLLESLRKVLRVAVSLSIEMRTQLAEYIMLPPLQPEYDTNGDLARHVYFNASLMNERSGETTSNEELETNQSVVRIVLFPLVVKKGNDTGEGEDEVVVCPAQVLIARPSKNKSVMSLNANRSAHSIAPPSTMDMGNVI